MGRKRRNPVLEEVEIIDIAAEGKAIGKHNDMVVFVPQVIPGDVVDIQVTRKRKKYMEGKATKFHKYSNDRTEAFCNHFGICGGCKWQMLPYDKQLAYKQKQVDDNLSRIGKANTFTTLDIAASDFQKEYRNKLEFTFSACRWLTDEEISVEGELDRSAAGFHVPGRFDRVIDIDQCYLQASPSNEIRNSLNKFCRENKYEYYHHKDHTGFLRNLIIRNSDYGEIMVIVVFAQNKPEDIEKCMSHLKAAFPEIDALLYVINTKLNDTIHDQDVMVYHGKDHIIELLGDKRYKIGPKSFFQTNSKQAKRLYDITVDFADFNEHEVVYDLYTGTGSIANYIAPKVSKVVGIEYVPEAIEDAFVNAEINRINNVDFYAGDMKDVLNEAFIGKHGKPDTIITDPPRAGMHADVVDVILKTDANKIVYVSCNPATQSRDIQLLSEKYELVKVQAVDMFPHTHHVESVALLVKN